ncbi:unnamed protein product [Discosporangium mesarthrocarpum]
MAAIPEGNAHIPIENAVFAVPKKGRLYDRCMKLLDGAGMDHRRPERVDIAQCTNLPVTLVFLPAHDIATYVGEGNVDMGITGLDVLQETSVSEDEIEVAMELGFGKCKLCVLAPVSAGIKDVGTLAGKRIVTSFPELSRRFFSKFDGPEPTHIKYVSGSVEAACGLGLADAVVDLVETGTTMKAAGLEIVGEVLNSQCLLIVGKKSKHRELVDLIVRRIDGYITAEKYMMISYNVSKADLDKAKQVTPGKRSPTVSQLEDKSWVAVQALINKKDTSSIMDSLQAVGATDILLFSLQNTRM